MTWTLLPTRNPTRARPATTEEPGGSLTSWRQRAVTESTVPGRIRTISGISLAALILLFGVLTTTVASARTGLEVTGHSAGPQAVATADLYFALSDMDGQVATVLLLGTENGERRLDALIRYDRRRTEAGRALLQASALAGTDPTGQRTVDAVLGGLVRYERLASQALLLNDQNRHAPGPPPRRVIEAYRQATDLMRTELLPQAYNLSLESSAIVRRAYTDAWSSLEVGRGVVALGGALALGCLLWLQMFLARRFRRVFGPSLLVASAIAGLYTFTGLTVLEKESTILLSAQQNGVGSVLTLAKTRAISNSMQADQSRYLLDPQRADIYELTYLDKAQSILYIDAGSVDAYQAQVAAAVRGNPRGAVVLGLLGTELRETASADQFRDAVRDVLTGYDRLQRASSKLRELTEGGQGGEAVAVRLGQVNDEFKRFDGTLVKLSDRHQAVFNQAITEGESALADLLFLLPVAMVSIAVLLVAGVLPRLNEYR